MFLTFKVHNAEIFCHYNLIVRNNKRGRHKEYKAKVCKGKSFSVG